MAFFASGVTGISVLPPSCCKRAYSLFVPQRANSLPLFQVSEPQIPPRWPSSTSAGRSWNRFGFGVERPETKSETNPATLTLGGDWPGYRSFQEMSPSRCSRNAFCDSATPSAPIFFMRSDVFFSRSRTFSRCAETRAVLASADTSTTFSSSLVELDRRSARAATDESFLPGDVACGLRAELLARRVEIAVGRRRDAVPRADLPEIQESPFPFVPRADREISRHDLKSREGPLNDDRRVHDVRRVERDAVHLEIGVTVVDRVVAPGCVYRRCRRVLRVGDLYENLAGISVRQSRRQGRDLCRSRHVILSPAATAST